MRLRLLLLFLSFMLLVPAASQAKDLRYWGGKTLPSHHIHLIWWGKASNFSSSRNQWIMQLFKDVAKNNNQHNIYSILGEYPSSSPSRVNLGDVDSLLTPLPRVHNALCPRGREICVGMSELEGLWQQISRAKPAWQWDEENLYMILLPRSARACFGYPSRPQCSNQYWSGLHSGDYQGLQGFPWAMVADQSDLASLSYVFTHEHLESITDPFPVNLQARQGISGWQDLSGEEISDLCEGGNLFPQFIGPHRYLVGKQWSNHYKKCVAGSSYQAAPQHALAPRNLQPFPALRYLHA